MKIRHEPAMTSAVISAVLGLLVGYGILTEARASLWSALAFAVLPLAQGWVTRSLVVPLSKLRSQGRRVPSREEVFRVVDDAAKRRR